MRRGSCWGVVTIALLIAGAERHARGAMWLQRLCASSRDLSAIATVNADSAYPQVDEP